MILKTFELRENVTLDCYFVTDRIEETHDAMIVLPGGGYSKICGEHEGEPIALAFLMKGFHSFVLNYTIAPLNDPYQPLVDASLAVAFLRENAEKFGLNRDRIFLTGFSAGAHLAAMLGSLWNDSELMEKSGLSYGMNRPNGVILCYPVISSELQKDERVFTALLGEHVSQQYFRDRFSAEKQLHAESAPAFLVHTMTDETVPVKNSLVFAEMMAKHQLLCELHIYPAGPHGMALANSVTNLGLEVLTDEAYARWVDDACLFLKRIQ